MKFKTEFLTKPVCHRALHNVSIGITENSLEAIDRAITANLPIEIDLQNTKDAKAVVFHDPDLDRLTNLSGKVNETTLAELEQTPLKTGGQIISFKKLLDFVNGQVPLLVEVKYQDEIFGPNLGTFLPDIFETAQNYQGPIAFMSFNPYLVAALQKGLPDFPMGLITDAFSVTSWPKIPAQRRENLRNRNEIPDLHYDFISHNWRDLERVKDETRPKLCWTVRSEKAEKEALKIADNITFEGYKPHGYDLNN